MKLFLFAGETSGDHHGAHLMPHLKGHDLFGVGGPEMRRRELRTLLPMEDFQVMGFTQVLGSLPKLYKQFQIVRKSILDENPEAVILIDYPGFNLRMAQALKKAGYRGKVIQYISPSVWAWGKGRIKTMEKYLDHLLVIFPFEPPLFDSNKLDVTYVGHPLLESPAQPPPPDNTLALYPGSRRGEIEAHLPLQLETLKYLPDEVKPIISCAAEKFRPLIEKLAPGIPIENGPLSTTAAFAKAGTITLELALQNTPSIVFYRPSLINYYIARYFIRPSVDYVCLVNILADKEVFPEFVRHPGTPKEYAIGLLPLLSDTPERKKILKDCTRIKSLLGTKNASKVAARTILECLH